MTVADTLEQGRESYRRQAWERAYTQLTTVDAEDPLAPEDLDRLARSAFRTGREAVSDSCLSRAHKGFREPGVDARGARCAIW